ncbi:hypothetical protein AB0425_26955 [Actinosynnema sp. NPDC051121]|nr:hypothetical protein [Saccharothrix sp.]
MTELSAPLRQDLDKAAFYADFAEDRQREGRLHLTVSLLIQHEDLRRALSRQAPGLRWDKKLVDTLRTHEESRALSRAIEPLFNDIADRKRGLFVEDFLIDTDSIDPSQGYGPNVCDIVDVEMPERISWSTEGRDLRLELDQRVRFESVFCRAFWVAHSNLSLSYHLSFEIPYQHTAPHYFALSLLQKAFFPSEGAEVKYEEGTFAPTASSRITRTYRDAPLPEYVKHRFEIDVVGLFGTVLNTAHADSAQALDGAALTRILLEPEGRERQTSLRRWNRKCLSVLEDPYLFGLLDQDVRSSLPDLDAVEPKTDDNDVLTYGVDALDRCHPEDLAHYFMSGFFQNVIDFLRQDISEVKDGTDPIYPKQGADYFVVFATPGSLYEVVAQSRSLNTGRGWIGTCPYLFLVHLMTLHNEDLVERYEREVRGLIEHLEGERLLGDPGPLRRPGRSSGVTTFQRFRTFRLRVFEEVERHRYFNVLRYDTERAFYEEIERVRGIQQRVDYWGKVVSDLQTTVDDLRNEQQRQSDDRRNNALGALAFIGLLQVVYQLLDFVFDDNPLRLAWAVGTGALVVLLAFTAVSSRRGR